MYSRIRLLTALSILFLPTTQAYVVAQMPRHRQVALLEEMTESICSTQPGALSGEMLKCAPDLMSAWAHLDSPMCALKVESLVKRVIDERLAGNMEATMTLSEYNYLLEGWARSGAGQAAAERCTQIVQEMQHNDNVHPDLSSFKAVLLAWKQSRSKDAPHEALKVLEWMAELYENGDNPKACPDSDCFDVVLQIWSRSGRKDAPETTEKILYAMEALYEVTQNNQLKPRTTSFNAVMSAWAKSNHPTAWRRVLDIFGFMELLSQSSDCTVPDQATYLNSIIAITRSKDADADPVLAEQLLKRVESIYFADNEEEEVETNVRPSTIMYNAVIGCYSRRLGQGHFRKAKSILDHQLHVYRKTNDDNLRPDVYGFTSVMGASAMETKEKPKAFDVALGTYQHLRHHPEFGMPNHVTYGSMLKCCGKLLSTSDPRREKWVRRIWDQCVEHGCVGDMVLSRLREAATGPLYKELMGGVHKRHLPQAWTRNVHEERDIRKKRSHRKKKSAEV